MQKLESQLRAVINGEDIRPIEFQLHDREVDRRLHAELQQVAASGFAEALQQVYTPTLYGTYRSADS